MPERVLGFLKQKICRTWKVAFFAAVLTGLFAHLYKITNWLPNWDGLVFRYDAQNMLGLGRWFLPVVCAPGSFYDLPFLSGMTAILFHAVSAVCICEIFKIKKDITAFLIGASFAAFLPVTSVMLYSYVADGYSIACFMACLAVVLLVRERPKYFASAVLIMLSAAIYQAYVMLTVSLILVYGIIEITRGEKARAIYAKFAKFLLTGALGMAAYYLALVLLLKLTGTSLLSYQGVDAGISLSAVNLAASFYTMKNALLGFFADFSEGVHIFPLVSVLILLCTALSYLCLIVRHKLSAAQVCTVIAFVLLLPVGANLLLFINPEMDLHNLMKMGYFSFFLPFILLYERPNKTASAWGILSLCAVLIISQIVLANISYHKLQLAYEKSYGTLIRIAAGIEAADEGGEAERLLIIGQLPESEAYSALLPPDITGTTDGLILRADDESVGQSVLTSALNDYTGSTYAFISGTEKEDLMQNEEIQNMKPWPAKESVKKFGDILVIKLGA